MRFKIDENLPVDLTDLLRSAGHDALSVFDQNLVGEKDPRILEVCRKEKRALVTLDLDFSDIRTYPPQQHYGLIGVAFASSGQAIFVGNIQANDTTI